nr:transketolase-like protein 2 [Zootoca vivipara]
MGSLKPTSSPPPSRWNTYVVDGHKVEELCEALWQASQQKGKPTAIVAKTFKGRGIAGVEDADNWHGKPMPKEKMESIINALQGQMPASKVYSILPPAGDVSLVTTEEIKMPSPPAFKIGEKMATRKAYGLALAKLGSASPRVVALDGDTKNSTFAELFKQAHPERFIECFIAEQNMVSVALGCGLGGRHGSALMPSAQSAELLRAASTFVRPERLLSR